MGSAGLFVLDEKECVEPWGRLLGGAHAITTPPFQCDAREILAATQRKVLPIGAARSYGDVCLNRDAGLICTTRLDRLISADWVNGVIRAEAGLTLDALLKIAIPRGWYPPVLPGTKFVTLGGAVANDVHGKNHESAGTFGCHVRRLGLARSDGALVELSETENTEFFAATIGGLGLTGLILWVELQLKPVTSSHIDTETLEVADLDEFFRLAEASSDWDYTVAWVDCLASGKALGRGLFMRGRHAEGGPLRSHGEPHLSVPLAVPSWLLNGATMSAFNAAYRARPWAKGRRLVHYDPFFHPLDFVSNWNRLYGRRGFYQHQSVVPHQAAPATLRRLLGLTAEHREGSFLTVLKLFGDRRSPGLMSFPMPGATLAVDIANQGESTQKLLRAMTDATLEAGGRVYPAKDATMSADAFRRFYPDWQKVEALRDPKIMSDFWRRVAR